MTEKQPRCVRLPGTDTAVESMPVFEVSSSPTVPKVKPSPWSAKDVENASTVRHTVSVPIKDRVDFVSSFVSLRNIVSQSGINEDFRDVDPEWWNETEAETEYMDKMKTVILMHTHLAKIANAVKNGNPPDLDLPGYDSLTVGLADCIICAMDMSGAHYLPVAQAILQKIQLGPASTWRECDKDPK